METPIINPKSEPPRRWRFQPKEDLHVIELAAIIALLELIVVNENGYNALSNSSIDVLDPETDELSHRLELARHFVEVPPASPIQIVERN